MVLAFDYSQYDGWTSAKWSGDEFPSDPLIDESCEDSFPELLSLVGKRRQLESGVLIWAGQLMRTLTCLIVNDDEDSPSLEHVWKALLETEVFHEDELRFIFHRLYAFEFRSDSLFMDLVKDMVGHSHLCQRMMDWEVILLPDEDDDSDLEFDDMPGFKCPYI